MGAACLVCWARANAGQAPSVTINPASDVTAYSATITGSVNPNGSPATVFVGWGTALAYTGEWVVTLPAQDSSVAIGTTLTNLMSNTTYLCWLSANNTVGLAASSLQISFTTLEAPTAITGPAANITVNSASIYGTLNANGFDTTYYFQWGTNTAYGDTTAPFSVLAQNTPISGITRTLSGLSPSTTYHYELVAMNSEGTHFGGDRSFTTLSTISIQGQVFSYSTNNGTVTIWGYAGPGGAVTIPSTIAGLPVTAIADRVFLNFTKLTSVTLAETVTGLGEWEFAGCTGLTNITLPNSLTNLGGSCFAGCINLQSATLSTSLSSLSSGAFDSCTKLASIAIPNSITNIASGAFQGCTGLTNVTFGNGILSIGPYTFWNCSSLTNAIIPAGTKSIDLTAFADCTNLSALNVDALNTAYASVDGVLLDKSQTAVLLCPQGKTGNYIMPNSITNIGQMSFYHCSQLTNVVFGNSVATIEAHAFEGCVGLTRLVLPDSLTTIQDGVVGKIDTSGVFDGCTGLSNVTFGKGLTYLGVGAFFYCTNLVGVYFHGDAPVLGSAWPRGYGDLFLLSPATVYYLPGTTGWGTTLADHPAILWNPLAQTHDASFGLKPSDFGFNIAGTADIPLVVEACPNLGVQSWVPLQSCTLTNGLIYFSDVQWTNYPGRVYRIRSP
jgi:hypothetical protein